MHESMLGAGVTPDADAASLILDAALQAGHTDKAFGLAHSLQVG